MVEGGGEELGKKQGVGQGRGWAKDEGMGYVPQLIGVPHIGGHRRARVDGFKGVLRY